MTRDSTTCNSDYAHSSLKLLKVLSNISEILRMWPSKLRTFSVPFEFALLFSVSLVVSGILLLHFFYSDERHQQPVRIKVEETAGTLDRRTNAPETFLFCRTLGLSKLERVTEGERGGRTNFPMREGSLCIGDMLAASRCGCNGQDSHDW